MAGFVELMEAYQAFIKESLKEMQLLVKPDRFDQLPVRRAIEVYNMRLKTPQDAAKMVPYVLLQMLNGADVEKENGDESHTVEIRAIITVYDQDAEQGTLALMNIIEKLRADLLSTRVIGEHFELESPFEWLIYPKESDPYYVAEIATVWSIPAINRYIPKLYWGD